MYIGWVIDWTIRGSILAGEGELSFLRNVHTDCGSHKLSYLTSSEGFSARKIGHAVKLTCLST
jgi:hypothetical protein